MMLLTQILWVLIAIGPFAASATLMILTPNSRAERKTWVRRMPRRALMADLLLRTSLWLAVTLLAYKGFSDLHRVAHGDAGTVRPGDLAGLLLIFASLYITVVPAYAAANLLVWLIAPLRRANRAAAEGLATLAPARLALTLLLQAALLIPTALAQGILAALEPWAR